MKNLLATLTFIAMTNIAVSKEPYVVELVVYKVKSELKDDFHDILEQARMHIQSLPGMVEYNTFRSTSNELVFIDIVKWESLETATDAAKKVEKMKELAPFMNAFEEVKFMDHFEQFTFFNQSEEIDLFKTNSDYYEATLEPRLLTVEKGNYLMINGISAPEDEKFLKSIEAIYALAFGIKFHYKAKGQDFVVPMLEAQWWVEGSSSLEEASRDDWNWNLMVPMPDFVDRKSVEECLAEVIKKKDLKQLSEVEFRAFEEGKCVQVLHIGSYEREKPSIEKIFKYMSENNLEVNGHHHEIYISDPMKTPEEKLKTIIRYPVK